MLWSWRCGHIAPPPPKLTYFCFSWVPRLHWWSSIIETENMGLYVSKSQISWLFLIHYELSVNYSVNYFSKCFLMIWKFWAQCAPPCNQANFRSSALLGIESMELIEAIPFFIWHSFFLFMQCFVFGSSIGQSCSKSIFFENENFLKSKLAFSWTGIQ